LPSTYFDPALGITSKRSLVRDGNGTNNSWIIEPQLSYEQKVGFGELSALIGTSYQEQRFDKKAISYWDFPSNALLHNISAAANMHVEEYEKSIYRYGAIFGRINYNIDKKYIINLTGRRDGSSRFGPGKQFGVFGAAGLAWLFYKEKWMERYTSFLSFGKLRASYGSTGNDQIGNYKYLDTYDAANNPVYQGIVGLNPTALYNPVYGWEVNRKLEAALELGFLKDRITVTVGYYRNRSSNQLINYTLPLTTGFPGILSNFAATVQNTGIELDLNTVNIQQRNFKWATSFNITLPKNRLIAFPGIDSSTYANQYIVGRSIYIRKFYQSTGVDPNTGLYSFKDYNNDGAIKDLDDNRAVIDLVQNFYGGFNNTITYKNWSLDIFFQFVKQMGLKYISPFVPIESYYLEKKWWQKPGDIAEVQRASTISNSTSASTTALITYVNYTQSDAMMSDASFIRCKNISLNYQFPATWIKGISGRIYIQAQNLFVISGYEGFDPESQGGQIAPLKMLTAGMQISL
jgi:hypothetical protein